MEEKHTYKSRIEFGSVKYSIEEVKQNLLSYLENTQNATEVYTYLPSGLTRVELRGFNSKGISVHYQASCEPETSKLRFIDVTLVSEVTPTADLEQIIRAIGDKHKRQPAPAEKKRLSWR